MKAFILFNYGIFRGVKDALIVTAGGSGVEVISFIKFWVIVPVAFLFFIVYTKLSSVLSKSRLFYVSFVPFIIYFALFAFWIYPNKDMLQPAPEIIEGLKLAYPRLQWLFPIWGHWTYVTFYIMAELWVSVVILLLFWQFANDITRVSEARRYYALLGVLGSSFIVGAGFILEYFTEVRGNLPPGADQWGESLQYLMSAAVLSGLITLAIYYWMQKVVVPDPRYCVNTTEVMKKPKIKVGLRESFRHVFSSRYLGFIAILVFCYGITINLIELTWKDQLKTLNPDPNTFTNALGGVIKWAGVATMVLTLIGANILRVFSWRVAAMATPIVFGVTGFFFFAFVLFQDTFAPVIEIFGWTPIIFAAGLGAIQNVFSKSTKNALFDPTKEMAYIPLDEHLKVKGKAAVDVVGNRLGKAGGALVQQGLLIAIVGSTQAMIAPYLSIVVFIMIALWVYAVYRLDILFKEKTVVPSADDE